MLNELKTKRLHLPVIRNEREIESFFLSARSERTLDLMTENVLRANNVDVDFSNWANAADQAEAKGYGPIVIAFINRASTRLLEVRV